MWVSEARLWALTSQDALRGRVGPLPDAVPILLPASRSTFRRGCLAKAPGPAVISFRLRESPAGCEGRTSCASSRMMGHLKIVLSSRE